MDSWPLRAWRALAVHVLPSRCFVCDGVLPGIQHLGSCASCWARLAPLTGPACRSCGLPLAGACGRCARCAIRPLPLESVTAAFVYDDVARRFLLRAKSGGRRELLRPFGRQLAAAVRASGIARGVAAIVVVPSAPLARLRRGFDPAHALGREIASALGLPFDPRRLRRRERALPPSKSLDAPARWRSARRAFVAARGDAACVLLVDDVMTTGATASACAEALLASGAREVRVAVWARTL